MPKWLRTSDLDFWQFQFHIWQWIENWIDKYANIFRNINGSPTNRLQMISLIRTRHSNIFDCNFVNNYILNGRQKMICFQCFPKCAFSRSHRAQLSSQHRMVLEWFEMDLNETSAWNALRIQWNLCKCLIENVASTIGNQQSALQCFKHNWNCCFHFFRFSSNWFCRWCCKRFIWNCILCIQNELWTMWSPEWWWIFLCCCCVLNGRLIDGRQKMVSGRCSNLQNSY